MNKIEIGKRYRNLHTGKICEVWYKVFYRVAYSNEGEQNGRNPHFCHYKTFLKNWVMEEEKIKKEEENEHAY